MAAVLRKDSGEGAYRVSSLDGVDGPGRRVVRTLTVHRSKGRDSLAVLPAFTDLEVLELEYVEGADLAHLTELGLRRLRVEYGTELDLDPLQRIEGLESLSLLDLDRVRVPALALPGSLLDLGLVNDDPCCSGTVVKQLVEAIDWSALGALQSLGIQVGGNTVIEPIRVDLGFLRELRALEYLDISQGVWHDGPEPSPLEPPFVGLSRRLKGARIDAWDPEPVRAALAAFMGITDPYAGPGVAQRYEFEPGPAEWSVSGPEEEGEHWAAYGSLVRHERAGSDQTEYDAYRRAQSKLRRADPRLARRIDFDPEAGGTGILASSREDLEAALRILGLGER